MLFYGGPQHSVCAWNAVDVLIDGQLQHGRVINVAEKGLIIDFECPSRRSQLVKYGNTRMFRCHKQYERPIEFAQVLLRRHPDGAWIWYWGKIVPVDSYSSADFEYLDVERPYGTVRELVPREQIRSPLSCAIEAQLRVKAGDFVVRSSPLPFAYRSLSNDWHLLGQAVHGELARRHGLLFTGVNTMCRSSTFYTTQNEAGKSQPPLEEVVKMRLPPVLLVKIFQSLDSIGRVRCRRVCQVWNTLLTTEAHFPDVRVCGNHAEYRDFPRDGMYWVAACLLKCLSSATKLAVMSKLVMYDGRHLPATLNHILAPGRLPVLVFHDCDLGSTLSFFKRVAVRTADLIVQCSCDRVVWKKCRVPEESFVAFVAQESIGVQSHHQMEAELWDVFERNLFCRQLCERQTLQDWITETFRNPAANYRQLILKVLNEYQSADPRESTHYRQREWTAANIADLDAGRLTAVTVAVLSKYFRWAR
ncbi:uncharacterized protein LOC129601740 isoform X2 [Paramacrobiotus metropolitanus]|uniref:uncharacterized protein LOC129601740 isoform X2 n=1 Tax=Paramacrobiotus metropolitanus TaxID=2943436 RepID=UPI002445BD87|nr:uncharacterized protein LOC129601740 isoform X2 [Paramacrobiotus metropolitanus]